MIARGAYFSRSLLSTNTLPEWPDSKAWPASWVATLSTWTPFGRAGPSLHPKLPL